MAEKRDKPSARLRPSHAASYEEVEDALVDSDDSANAIAATEDVGDASKPDEGAVEDELDELSEDELEMRAVQAEEDVARSASEHRRANARERIRAAKEQLGVINATKAAAQAASTQSKLKPPRSVTKAASRQPLNEHAGVSLRDIRSDPAIAEKVERQLLNSDLLLSPASSSEEEDDQRVTGGGRKHQQ